jgi:hypothetical protein
MFSNLDCTIDGKKHIVNKNLSNGIALQNAGQGDGMASTGIDL